MSRAPILVSHALCPYVQRAAIVLREKGAAFERRDIDLAHKPDWFLAVSPLAKTPVLLVGAAAIFESAVICEYLDDTLLPRLHPEDALRRARHRGWMEFASGLLNLIAGLYNAPNEAALAQKAGELRARFLQVEQALGDGPWFDGGFGMVDAAFAPVFRYFEVIDGLGERDLWQGLWQGLEKVPRWRRDLLARPSVQQAVGADYPARLRDFLGRRDSALGRCVHG